MRQSQAMDIVPLMSDTEPIHGTPAAPYLAVTAAAAFWRQPGGETEALDHASARRRLASGPMPVLCHAPTVFRRLNCQPVPALDLLELFVFVRPAAACLPTVAGLAQALGVPSDDHDLTACMEAATGRLLDDFKAYRDTEKKRAATLAMTLARAGWPWGPAVLAALDMAGNEPPAGRFGGLDVWNGLAEFEDRAPPPAPGGATVSPAEAAELLKRLLGDGAEDRADQTQFAEFASVAFSPRDRVDEPRLALAEAGTGIGKTLGYIAPAAVWARKNEGTVWLSTFTKNLQRQIDGELNRLYPDPAEKAEKVVVRKGRENYLCLLNLEEAAQGGAARDTDKITLGLLARWAAATRDGDMVGGDFPAWLTALRGTRRTTGLTDRRGECVYSACPHYRKCFIERSRRQAQHAEMVIANHALVMIRAAWNVSEGELPLRYVFDEGHHLFGAADSAFSAHLSGQESVELRRWLRGGEAGRRSRARGLSRRIGDLMEGREGGAELLVEIEGAAGRLAGDGWLERLRDGSPLGPTEAFLGFVRQQTLARASDRDGGFSLETTPDDPVDGLLDAAAALQDALARLSAPIRALQKRLANILDEEAEELDTGSRIRLEAAMGGLERRAGIPLAAWQSMLADLNDGTPDAFVDWFSVTRIAGREADTGYHRHWIDPTLPFAETVLRPAHGALVTSATLLDQTVGEETDWASAEVRTGALHLVEPAARISLASPFDHAAQTRIYIVTDVRRDDPDQVAAAYRSLFIAAGGGALGLFTAIWRLRAVHKRIVEALEEHDLPLYAQHVDAIDTGTLVDIFRAETDSCLLGTDAVRDGVDVPGRALRLIVFDRVPWPRPDILHRARRKAFGGNRYDDMLTRLRLKQAYGRLLRRQGDAGVFVMLDAMTPSRLLNALPPSVAVERVGLADAVAGTRDFLQSQVSETDE